MVKERQAHVQAEIVGDKLTASFYGKEDDLAYCFERSMIRIIDNHPEMRRKLHRAERRAMRATMPEWVAYWLDGWPLSVAGAALIFGVVYAFSAFVHWIGGVI